MRDARDNAPQRVRRYRQLLFKHLAQLPPTEVEFFVNARRFRTLQAVLGPHLAAARILNVACGPFALEFYVAPQAAVIDSLDVDPALSGLHAELLAEGLIAPSRFVVSELMAYDAKGAYDIVVVNDLFYTKYVDFYAVLDKYVPLLAPGGRIYFDILDKRAGPIWALFNKDHRYRRYDLTQVRSHLAARGLVVEAEVVSTGIKGGLDAAGRRLLWALARIPCNMIFMARRDPAAGMEHPQERLEASRLS